MYCLRESLTYVSSVIFIAGTTLGLYIQNKETITSLALSNEEYLEENRQIRDKIYSIS